MPEPLSPRPPAPDTLTVAEREPARRAGRNDTLATAERIRRLSTGRHDVGDARITGTLADVNPPAVTIGPFAETSRPTARTA